VGTRRRLVAEALADMKCYYDIQAVRTRTTGYRRGTPGMDDGHLSGEGAVGTRRRLVAEALGDGEGAVLDRVRPREFPSCKTCHAK
jgi:hypothetical protein